MSEVVTFAEFARRVRTSEPTLRKRLSAAPAGVVTSRGKSGRAYQISVGAGLAWWSAAEAEGEQLDMLDQAIKSDNEGTRS